jgi:hypothetical protein
MPLDDRAIIAAVGEVLAQERAQRLTLQARIEELASLLRQPGPEGKQGEQGEPGRDGSVGECGETGSQGPPGPTGETGRDGRDGLPGLLGPTGERGERGPAGEQGPEGSAGPTGSVGEKGDPGEPAYPGQARGLWNENENYRAMDVVTYNGSEWRAVSDDPGPLPGDGWVLGAKGNRGKPGERGAKGEKGERGPAGLSLVRADMVGFELVLTLSDETRLVCNMLGAFERYHREAVA